MTSPSKTLAAGAALLCGLGLVTPAAFAASLSPADHDFLVSTAQGTTYELAAAKLALSKATLNDIKSYAQAMIDAHGRLNPQLHELAQKNGIDLPTGMTDAKQQSYDKLKSLDGKAFDTAFVTDETQDNENDLKTEQKEIETTKDASVKAFVEQLKKADTEHAKFGQALQQAGK